MSETQGVSERREPPSVGQPLNEHRGVIADRVTTRKVGNGLVLLDGAGASFALDPVGARAWSLLVSAPSFRVAYETLLAEFEVDPDELERDLLSLIQQLVTEGLLEIARV